IDRLGELGMNLYVPAPKDDPLHRERWRETPPAEELERFAELVARGRGVGVTIGCALSPGLSIRYSSAADVRALVEKLRLNTGLGAGFAALCLDDVPTELAHAEDRGAFASLADAHVSLATAVREALPPEVTLWVAPTDYAGTEASDYAATLGAALAPEIELAWTGRTTIPPTIPADEAAARARLLGRKLLLWDNVPVADGPMRTMLHLGPYLGRDPGLVDSLSGVLLNPMQQARASYVAIAGAAAWLADPAGFDPEASWRDAVRRLGTGAPAAFETFAAAHRFSPLSPTDRDPALERAWRSHREGGDTALPALLEDRIAAGNALRAGLDDRRLLAEIEPWLAGHERESRRMAAAVELLEALRTPGTSLDRCLAFVRFEGRLTRNAPAATTSYGPRRVLYPQLRGLWQGEARFADDPALYRDRCLADEMVRAAEAEAERVLGAKPAGE
ncbi:MAG: beta-N-acetylglucosaminidase domain-containing protein, partial [Myxococcota bacterium]